MSPFRYRLRTLLLVALATGAGLGWWLRPHTIREFWPDGQLKSELRVRRNWKGQLVTNGMIRWWWKNGPLAREGRSFGFRAKGHAAFSAPLVEDAMFLGNGQPVEWPPHRFAG